MWEKCNLRHGIFSLLICTLCRIISEPITIVLATMKWHIPNYIIYCYVSYVTIYKIIFEFGARVLKVLSTTFFLSDSILVFSQWMIWIVICKYTIQKKTSAYTQLTKSNYL